MIQKQKNKKIGKKIDILQQINADILPSLFKLIIVQILDLHFLRSINAKDGQNVLKIDNQCFDGCIMQCIKTTDTHQIKM